MSNYLVTDTELSTLAGKIRTKGGTQAQLTWPGGFNDAVDAIPTGGGGDDDYFYFEPCNTGETLPLSIYLSYYTRPNIKYSTDKTTWTSWTSGTLTISQKTYFKVEDPVLRTTTSFWKFTCSGTSTLCKIGGNINSLILGIVTDAIAPTSSSYSLFADCSFIKDASDLKLGNKILMETCYMRMFKGCTNLTEAPQLPSMSLAQSCYKEMFMGCSSLVIPPSLPATDLDMYCYNGMFEYCSQLKYVPALATTGVDYGAYTSMFDGCSSLIVSDESVSGSAEIAWTIPSSGTFTYSSTNSNMFRNCGGTRSSNDLTTTVGTSKTYYTQNTPVSA